MFGIYSNWFSVYWSIKLTDLAIATLKCNTTHERKSIWEYQINSYMKKNINKRWQNDVTLVYICEMILTFVDRHLWLVHNQQQSNFNRYFFLLFFSFLFYIPFFFCFTKVFIIINFFPFVLQMRANNWF